MQLSADMIAMVLSEEIGIGHIAVKIAEMGERGELSAPPAPTPQPIETAPKSGRFMAWWRTKRLQRWEMLEWTESGLWAGSAAINEIETAFSHWLPEPPAPTN
jgi:hypothetical protein